MTAQVVLRKHPNAKLTRRRKIEVTRWRDPKSVVESTIRSKIPTPGIRIPGLP